MALALSQPTGNDERVRTLDFCRGIAVLGIFLCNIAYMAFPETAIFSHQYISDVPFMSDFIFYWLMFFDGTQRGMFSLLFGVGMIVFIERLSKKLGDGPATDLFFRRIAFLFVLGLVNGYVFFWPGDILAPYALFTFIAFAFRNSTNRTLIVMALAMTLVLSLMSLPRIASTFDKQEAYQQALEVQQSGETLTEEQQKSIDSWLTKPDIEKIDKQIEQASSGLVGGWQHSTEALQGVISAIYYWFFMDCVPMFFIGIVLYRVGVFKPDFPLSRLLRIGLVCIITGWSMRYVYAYHTAYEYDHLIRAYLGPIKPWLRVILTLGYLFTLIAAYRLMFSTFLAKALVAAGQMALTNYLTQSILAMVIFFGFGLFGALNGAEITLIVISVWAFQLCFSPLWLSVYRFGPFEWVWRSLTYGRLQPFKRADKVIVATA